MPEGPELKTSSDIIAPLLVNKYIVNMHPSKNGRYAKEEISNFDSALSRLPLKVENINVKGKFMHWKLGSENPVYLFCTYGMTGQWSKEETKHTCFVIQYLDASKYELTADNIVYNSEFIYFNDPRHFGTIKFGNQYDWVAKIDSLGWDPLEDSLKDNFDLIKKKINKSKKNIGELLLDQKIFCGCGNYVRAEALYRAKINPWLPGKSISDDQLLNICSHVKDVMMESYQAQGASFKSYINADGNSGKYSFNFQVYGQKKDPFGNDISRQVMGTRSIHWCPEVQKI